MLISKGRSIDYLRISLTDRCNLRCVYCMGADGIGNKFDCSNMMSLEDVAQFARVACAEGIRHIRLTGGEPLVRKGIVGLVRELSKIPQLEDLSMTTNGILFTQFGEQLKEAGLARVTFSMDSTNPDTFRALTRGGDLSKVYESINLAIELGLAPVKINALAYQLADDDLLEFMRMVTEEPIHVRFIEYMPIGHLGRELKISPTPPIFDLSMAQVRASIDDLAQKQGLGVLQPTCGMHAPLGHGPASSYRFEHKESAGSFGFIGIHSDEFCSSCNRLRLTADGKLRSCLFSELEIPVMTARGGNTMDSMRASLLQAVASKPRSYKKQQGTARVMSAIGG